MTEQQHRSRRQLTTIALNTAVVAASLAVLVNTALNVYPRWRSQNDPEPFPRGARAPALPHVDYSQTGLTLLLFVSTRCRYCIEDAPFFSELTAVARSAKGRRVIAVFPDPAELVDEFKSRTHLDSEVLSGIPLARLGVRGTPTLLLVSDRGTVVQSWEGYNPGMRAVVITALRAQ